MILSGSGFPLQRCCEKCSPMHTGMLVLPGFQLQHCCIKCSPTLTGLLVLPGFPLRRCCIKCSPTLTRMLICCIPESGLITSILDELGWWGELGCLK